MKMFDVKWFSSVAWAWHEISMLAESEDQIKAFVDLETAPEYRSPPYRNEAGDSLSIKELYDVKLPFVLDTRYYSR